MLLFLCALSFGQDVDPELARKLVEAKEEVAAIDAATAAQDDLQGLPPWTLGETVDPITNKKTTYAFLESSPIRDTVGNLEPAVLGVSCKRGEHSFYLTMPGIVTTHPSTAGGMTNTAVRARFGDEVLGLPAKNYGGANHNQVMFPDMVSKKMIKLLQKEGMQLVLDTPMYRGDSVATFHNKGVQALQDLCK